KSVFYNQSLNTLVFDEIDVGISGDIALKVAEKIQALSTSNQVFCITHLPQTASIGVHHYHLEKHVEEGRTVSTIKKLSEEEHLSHIAAIMSGKGISETALATARELMKHFNVIYEKA
ncbi:MAG: DNA repair protein RecN, partial [Veillonella sp.]|nr:DNA repair protein RecN [Veillonella sp.]